MAYTPINWQTGDTITADKLNKMDNGWGVESTQLFSETVTTTVDPEYPDDPAAAQLAYSGTIDADTITVTFDGTEYECPRIDNNGSYFYGGFSTSGPDFTNYPFFIYSGDINQLVTQTAGEHTIAAGTHSLDLSNSFVNAVAFHATVGTTTFQEIDDALAAGRLVVISESGSYGSSCQLVCSTDKTGVPLEVNVVYATSEGVSKNTYLASSASSPIVTN